MRLAYLVLKRPGDIKERRGEWEKGIAVNLRVELLIRRLEEVSPRQGGAGSPFEGGVAGAIDYLIFTKSIPRPGWLIGLSDLLFFDNFPYLIF